MFLEGAPLLGKKGVPLQTSPYPRTFTQKKNLLLIGALIVCWDLFFCKRAEVTNQIEQRKYSGAACGMRLFKPQGIFETAHVLLHFFVVSLIIFDPLCLKCDQTCRGGSCVRPRVTNLMPTVWLRFPIVLTCGIVAVLCETAFKQTGGHKIRPYEFDVIL